MEVQRNIKKQYINNNTLCDATGVTNNCNVIDDLHQNIGKNCKNYVKYECKICHYTTSRKGNYDAHLLTRKHEIETKTSIKTTKTSKKMKYVKTKNTFVKIVKNVIIIVQDCGNTFKNVKNKNLKNKNLKNKI